MQHLPPITPTSYANLILLLYHLFKFDWIWLQWNVEKSKEVKMLLNILWVVLLPNTIFFYSNIISKKFIEFDCIVTYKKQGIEILYKDSLYTKV